MAQMFNGRQSDWGFTGGGYVIGYAGQLSYSSIERNGNTVTVKGVTANGWFTSDAPYGMTNRGYMIFTRAFSYTAEFNAGGALVQRGYSIGAGTYYPGNTFGSVNFGDVSFSVTASQTSATCTFRMAGDTALSTTITFPANQKSLNVNVNKVDSSGNRTEVSDGSVGKFDEYVPNNNKIGNQVSDQVGWSYDTGSTYKIDNITEQSSDWYYTGSSSYSGTLNSDTTIHDGVCRN